MYVCACVLVQVFAALQKFLRLVAMREGSPAGEADSLFRRLQEEVRTHPHTRTRPPAIAYAGARALKSASDDRQVLLLVGFFGLKTPFRTFSSHLWLYLHVLQLALLTAMRSAAAHTESIYRDWLYKP